MNVSADQASPGAVEEPPSPSRQGSAAEVFVVALGLGLTSFGGPIAHLGYFERTYVQRRGWLSAADYAGLVALCQTIPGPASSQVGFLIGLSRAGWAGGLAAWVGFTLPSALMTFAFALLAPRLAGPIMQAALHGLKLVAVAVVAQAVWSMGRKLCADPQRLALAAIAAAMLLLSGVPLVQLAALLVGAGGGMWLCRGVEAGPTPPPLPIGRLASLTAGALFVGLLIALPVAASFAPGSMLGMAAIFYKAGALVFGGGHVILPLLREALVPTGWLSDSRFLSGYGAVQAMPGPLFSFAAYLGGVIAPDGSGLGGQAVWSLAALVFLFLPGLLLALAGFPLWRWLGGRPVARGALAGVNAAVVGVLAAALYNPIWTSAVLKPADLIIAAAGLVLLQLWRTPPILVAALCVVAAILMR